MLVYVICYGAGMLFASSAHYYLSGAALLFAALWLYGGDCRRSGNLLDLKALFSLFFVGGQGISCLKLSRLQTDWASMTWLCFFCAVVCFRLACDLVGKKLSSGREAAKEGQSGERSVQAEPGFAVLGNGEQGNRYDVWIFRAVILLTALSLAAFLLEAAILGYVPFLVRGVPHAYSYFHISGVHYVTVSCVLVPSMAVLWWFYTGGFRGEKRNKRKTALVCGAVLAALAIPILCVSRFQLIFGVILAVLTFMVVTGNKKLRYLVMAAAALVPLYVVLTIARSHDVEYLNGIFAMKNSRMPIFITQPYMYIANNYDNFNCLVEQLPEHSMGLKGMFPLWALTGLKFLVPELVNWPLYTTKEELTTVTLFYDAYYDFGILGVMGFGALLGAAARFLTWKTRPGKNPAWYLLYSQAALYFMLSFFTTWYSNPTTWFYFAVTLAFAIWCDERKNIFWRFYLWYQKK